MFKAESSIVINAPVSDVYDWMAHPHKHHDWQHSLLHTAVDDEKTVVVRKFLGRKVETHFHTVDRVPNKSLRRVGKSAAGAPVSYTVEQLVQFEETGGATKVTMTSTVDSGGALKSVVLSTFERGAKREQDSSLAHLKELVEADEAVHEVLAQMPRHTGA